MKTKEKVSQTIVTNIINCCILRFLALKAESSASVGSVQKPGFFPRTELSDNHIIVTEGSALYGLNVLL